MNSSTYSYRPNNNNRNKKSDIQSNNSFKFLLYYILPFIVVNSLIFYLVTVKPKFDVAVGETNDYLTTEVTITMKSIFPHRKMTVNMGADTIDLTKTGRKTYTATINKNGVLEILVDNFNGMSTIIYEHINILDDNPPVIASHKIEDDILTIVLEDSQSGIDYNSIYAIDSAEHHIQPLSIDKASATITFAMTADSLTVHASDISGNQVQAAITSRTVSESQQE